MPLEIRLKNIVETEPEAGLLKAFQAFTGSDEEKSQGANEAGEASLVGKKAVERDQDNSPS